MKTIHNCLISMYNKDGILPLLSVLKSLNIAIYATGGTYDYIMSSGTGNNLIKVEDIRKAAAMTSNTFTTYRTRLIDSGVVDGKQHGYLSFKLPRFEEFMNLKLY